MSKQFSIGELLAKIDFLQSSWGRGRHSEYEIAGKLALQELRDELVEDAKENDDGEEE